MTRVGDADVDMLVMLTVEEIDCVGVPEIVDSPDWALISLLALPCASEVLGAKLLDKLNPSNDAEAEYMEVGTADSVT